MRNAFDAGSIHYEGKWEGIGPCKLRLFWVPVKGHQADSASAIWGAKKSNDSQKYIGILEDKCGTRSTAVETTVTNPQKKYLVVLFLNLA